MPREQIEYLGSLHLNSMLKAKESKLNTRLQIKQKLELCLIFKNSVIVKLVFAKM